MLRKVINRIPKASSSGFVQGLVDASAGFAKKVSQSPAVDRAVDFLDNALMGAEATKLIGMQDKVAQRLARAAIPEVSETYARRVGTGIASALARGAKVGAAAGAAYGAFDDDTSVIGGAVRGAIFGGGASMLYAGYRSRHLMSQLAQRGGNFVVPRSMLPPNKLP